MTKKKGSAKGKDTKSKKKDKVLSEEEEKRLAADLKAGKKTNSQLAKEYGVSTKTINRRKKQVKEQKKEPSVLEMKLALEVSKADSVLVFFMEQYVSLCKMIADEKLAGDKKMKALVEGAEMVLMIRNALAFTEIPGGMEEGYTSDDFNMFTWLIESLPEDKKKEFYEKIEVQGTIKPDL